MIEELNEHQINDSCGPNEDLTKIENMKAYLQKYAPNFNENYELLNLIDSGSTGLVYKAKAKNSTYKQNFSFRFSFHNKMAFKNKYHGIMLQKKLHHINILKAPEYYKTSNNNFIAISEFAIYGNLDYFKRNIVKRQYLPETFINYFTKPILEGLNYIRRYKIIHKNINMGTIFLDFELNPKIKDFLLSFSFENLKPNDIIKLPIIGTGRYMAPEVLNEKVIEIKYGDKIDIYSLGVTLYNLAFGGYPYGLNNVNDDDYKKIKEKLNNEYLVFPKGYDISEMFINFLKNVLEKDYKKRYNIKEAMEDPWIKGWDIINEEKENIGIEENLKNFFVKLKNNSILNFNEYINNNC